MIKPTDPDIAEQASHWVLKRLDGAGSNTEQRAFQAWLDADPRHLPAYRHAAAVWRNFAPSEGQPADVNLTNARAQFREAQYQIRRARNRRLRGLALAALLVATPPLTWNWLNSAEYRTGKGQRLSVALADGSRVELNTDSRLRVNYAWQTRQVTLERGEAVFDVKHDPAKPFEVLAPSGRIRDIGTRFNVYQGRDGTTVSVMEGEVEVATVSSTLNERLPAGSQIHFDARGSLGARTSFDAYAVMAWQKNLLVFRNAPLTEVLEQLSRYHAVDLQLADPALRDLKVSGDFPSTDLTGALKVIAAALPIKIRQAASGVIVLDR